jgi:hypothetical protein
MQFDVLYTSDLSKSDLLRIMKLPEKVSLALPFLHTATEVNAHLLINKFYRDMDPEFFVRQDYFSEADGFDPHAQEGHEVGGSGFGLTKQALDEAEGVYDSLVREARRDRLRARTHGEGLTSDERDWLVIDRILAPDMYADYELDDEMGMKDSMFELTASTNPDIRVQGVTQFSQPKTSPSRPKISNADGDKYQDLRVRCEDGEEIFEEDGWKCPFDRNGILALRGSGHGVADDEARVQRLLELYYVDDNESVVGHQRLATMKAVLDEIVAISSQLEVSRVAAIGIVRNVPFGADDTLLQARPDGVVRRLWGSWDQVHPASGGLDSQAALFDRTSYNAARCHPAAYAIVSERTSSRQDELVKLPIPHGTDMLSLGLSTLQGGQSASDFYSTDNDPASNWYIVESLDELAVKDRATVGGKLVVVIQKDSHPIFAVPEASLQSRQSRSHRFEIPDTDSTRVLELTVSVIFQGTFSDRGYKLGRLAASLFRLPGDADHAKSPLPRPIGYAPHALVVPNSPNTLGRLVILHKPRSRPLRPGHFQIVIGSASFTKYSIEVTCRYARTALPLVDEEVERAKQMQQRLPRCLQEIESLSESLRLAERKLFICDKMIGASDQETKRAQRRMRTLSTRLEADDDDMLLREDERRELQREISILEIEFSEWVAIFGSRCKEKTVIKEGLELMHAAQIRKQQEKNGLKTSLLRYRSIIPQIVELLSNTREAANVAAALNAGASFSQSVASSVQVQATPAEVVRMHFRQKGWRALSLEEQQWSTLDQVMCPDKYEWLREQEEEDTQRRMGLGKRPKKRYVAAAVEAVRFTKIEIEHLLSRPFAMLSRKETLARKLLHRFHDNTEMMKQKFAESAYGFDVHLAERGTSTYVYY